MIWIGIDPGKTGAIAAVSDQWAEPQVVPLSPTKSEPIEIVRRMEEWAEEGGPHVFAVIEKVASRPGQSAPAMFNFGVGYGRLLERLTCCRIPYDEKTPTTWQRTMQCLSGGDKNVTKRRAAALFAELKVTHEIADALLLATYCKRTYPTGR
ncbi:MAG: hypothetical protein AAF532_16405 [Planctomycetota bacterium]